MPVRKPHGKDLARRWQRLPEGSRRVLIAAALHDDAVPDAWLAELAAEPREVDPLVADGWLSETTSGRWQVALGDGIARELAPWSMRRSAHLALARILERTPSQGAQAAAHFESGGQPADAGRVWLATARWHCRRQQHKAAAQGFAEAIRLLSDDTPEPELVAAVRDFGVCAALQRDTAQAIELLQGWRERAAWSALAAFQGHLDRILADLLTRQARHVEGAQIRRRGAKQFLAAGLGSEAAGELLAAAGTLASALRVTSAAEAAAEAVVQARACGRADLESQALAWQGLAVGMLGETERGRGLIEAALDVALTHRLTALAADAYKMLGNVADYASCYGDPSAFRKAIAYCARHDHTNIADLCRGCLCYALFRGGRWAEALRMARDVTEKTDGPAGSRAVGTLIQGMIRLLRGELRTGLRLVQSGRERGRATGIGTIEIFACTALAAGHEMEQRWAEAAQCYRQLMDYWLTTDDQHDVLFGFGAAVIFFSSRGEREQVAAFAAPLQRIAAGTSNREALGAAYHAAAELKLLDGKPAEAAEAFREALAAFEAQSCCIETIRTRIRLAAALRAAGEEAESTALLRAARARALRLGCRPLAAQASAGMAVAESGKTRATGGTLSPRQRDVAQHLTAGRTNKEIAGLLGLSVRTVDMHVAHLFSRLDCRTRTEAAIKLGAVRAANGS